MTMQIIIKGLKGFDIFPENKEYVERRFRKFEKMVKEPATLEFAFIHSHGTRANIDKGVNLTVTMPGLKKSEHLEELSEHFPESIDRLQKRFDKFLERFREKNLDKSRYPRKYKSAELMEKEAGEI